MEVTLLALWLPILVALVLVFVASNLFWMVLPFHKKDWKPLPDEDAFMAALGAQNPVPGEYTFPYAEGAEDWKSEAWQEKFKRGPVGFLTVRPAGEMGIAKSMVLWILYILVILIFVAYLGSQTLVAGQNYLEVFQVIGTAAILGFAGAAAPAAIWMGRGWGNTWKSIFEGVVYGLLTAGAFGWLWPAG